MDPNEECLRVCVWVGSVGSRKEMRGTKMLKWEGAATLGDVNVGRRLWVGKEGNKWDSGAPGRRRLENQQKQILF